MNSRKIHEKKGKISAMVSSAIKIFHKYWACFVFSLMGSLVFFVARVVKGSNFFENVINSGLVHIAIYRSVSLFILLLIFSLATYAYFDNISSKQVLYDVKSGSLCEKYINSRVPITYKESIRQRFVIYLLIILVMWVPWIVLAWPGSIRDDTIAQLMQSLTDYPYEDRHPIFDTLVFEVFWRIGISTGNLIHGLSLFIVFQALLLASGASLLICYLRKCGVPLFFEYVVLMFYSFDYVVTGAVPTMAKDSLHTVFMIPMAILFVECCRTRGAILRRSSVLFVCMTVVFLSIATKRTALMILLCSFIFLFVLAKGNRKRVLMCIVIPLILIQGVWQPATNRFLHVSHYPTMEVNGLIYQPIGRLESVAPQNIKPENRKAFSDLMKGDLPHVGDVYDPFRVDAVMYTIDNNALAEVRRNALRAWWSEALNNPRDYIKAYLVLFYGWFTPLDVIEYPSDLDRFITPSYMQQWSTFVHDDLNEAYKVLEPFFNVKSASGWRAETRAYIHDDSQGMVNARGVYIVYIPLFVALYLFSRKRWEDLTAWSLLGFTVLSLFASPVALQWYAIPLMFTLPVFVALLMRK